MNNTLGLSVFMALVFLRDLVWAFSAEVLLNIFLNLPFILSLNLFFFFFFPLLGYIYFNSDFYRWVYGTKKDSKSTNSSYCWFIVSSFYFVSVVLGKCLWIRLKN